MTVYLVQMQRTDGTWFDLWNGECGMLSNAKRKATARRKKNAESKNLALRPLLVRIIHRVDTEIEE